MPRKRNPKSFRRPFHPRYAKGRTKMWDDCVVLLFYASKPENRNKETSISLLSEATGIPRMTLHWILTDSADRKGNSILSRAAQHYGFDYIIYASWNRENAHKRRKKIIDAVRIYEKSGE